MDPFTHLDISDSRCNYSELNSVATTSINKHACAILGNSTHCGIATTPTFLTRIKATVPTERCGLVASAMCGMQQQRQQQQRPQQQPQQEQCVDGVAATFLSRIKLDRLSGSAAPTVAEIANAANKTKVLVSTGALSGFLKAMFLNVVCRVAAYLVLK